ncbi:MAG: hypothetical protein ABW061_28640, partial [Polyangiaceae bacterium]
MLRAFRVNLLSIIAVLSASTVAAAQETIDTPTADAPPSDESKSDTTTAGEPAPDNAPRVSAAAAPDATATAEGVSTAAPPGSEPVQPESAQDWKLEVHGYFRAPMALGLSTRPNPDTPDGPAKGQISYAPNRVVDGNYYSFAYTRLQEQDWAEITFHVKKKHVDAAVGWMGYWLASTSFRNPDSAAV